MLPNRWRLWKTISRDFKILNLKSVIAYGEQQINFNLNLKS